MLFNACYLPVIGFDELEKLTGSSYNFCVSNIEREKVFEYCISFVW